MSDDDWDIDEPVKSGTSTPAAAAPKAAPAPVVRAPARNKWADEDAEDDDEDDWDVSDSEKKKPAAAAPGVAAPVRKKKLKEKLAEKERIAQAGDDDLIDTRTEQERARQAKQEARERELAADLAVAGDLMGNLDVVDPKATLESILTSKPTKKEDFASLSQDIIALLARHQSNPLYPAFVEQLAKDLCEPLLAVQVRKVGSALATVGNTKQQEERDKANGKKKGSNKPKLAAAKVVSNVDTEVYDDVLDDDDFM